MGIIKGAIMSAVLYALGVVFWQQLIIAAVSAVLTAAGVVAAAIIAGRYTERNRQGIHDIKRGLGLDKREADKKTDGD